MSSANDLHKRVQTANNNNLMPTKISENGNSKNEIQDKYNNTHPLVYTVFISLLLDLLAFTMILPLLPSLLEHYRINDQLGFYNYLSQSVQYFQELVGAPDKYNSVLFGGFLGSMFSFLQFIASPIVGGLSDCYGRKPIMMICLVFTNKIHFL